MVPLPTTQQAKKMPPGLVLGKGQACHEVTAHLLKISPVVAWGSVPVEESVVAEAMTWALKNRRGQSLQRHQHWLSDTKSC